MGTHIKPDELKRKGEKIYREKLKLKVDMGFDKSKLKPQKRVFEVETFRGKLDERFIRETIGYYRKRVDCMIT
ncbi:hypothetical protein [Archaeoglobus sulfaticallidus]|uniref:hypothetical protein n=1 Tax=Archaeoglobus sulfaticallidus TaxID=1316941 RepID=UPI000693ED30|nr:hypothetical protein [Archaeoglobus sulfaticallidus]